MSAEGLALLTAREGSRNVMYRDSANLPTIGVGHLLTRDELTSGKLYLSTGPVDWHQGLTDAQVQDLLAGDVYASEGTINASVQVPLTQAQFDSLVSFRFNIGGTAFRNSTLLRLLNAKDYAAVPTQLRRWHFSAGQSDPVLIKRRESEVAQWLASTP